MSSFSFVLAEFEPKEKKSGEGKKIGEASFQRAERLSEKCDKKISGRVQ
jgi:hypothetical protein